MRYLFFIVPLVLSLTACRNKAPDDSITKPELKKQIAEVQAVSSGNITDQFRSKDEEFKTRIVRQILDSLDEESLKKLVKEQKFKDLLKKMSLNSRSNMEIELGRLKEHEKAVFEPLKISVHREVGLNMNKHMALVDPYLRYHVDSVKKKISCEDVTELEKYWDDFIGLLTNENLLLGITPQFFEQYTKSCLLYHRVRASMEKCQDLRTEVIDQYCRLGDNLKENSAE